MNFQNFIHSHVSIRSYLDRDVPEDVLQRILLAATRASSSGNMQAYSIIVTKNRELKEKLFQPHFQQSMVLQAPVLLTFCADFHRMKKWLHVNEAPQNFDNFMSFMIAAIDATLASQNAALAAEAEGLGICYMGTTLASCDQIGKILNCPANVIPVVGFSLGYPNEKPQPRDRLPLKALVHREVYDDEINVEEIYSEKELRGYERLMADPEFRQKVECVGAKNLAQIYTMVKYTEESHQAYSRTVLDYLREQNFLSAKWILL